MDYLNFVIEHKTEFVAFIGGVVTLASLFVKLTPTPEDDEILAKIIKILNLLAINPKK